MVVTEERAMRLRSVHYALMASWNSSNKAVRRKAESMFELSQIPLRIWIKYSLHVRENAVSKTSCNTKVFHGVGMGCVKVTNHNCNKVNVFCKSSKCRGEYLGLGGMG